MSNRNPFATPTRPMPAVASLPPRVHRLLEELRAVVNNELGRELERLLDTLEQDLFRDADRARNSGLQSGLLGALHTLREQRDLVVPRFMASLEHALAGLREPVPDEVAKPGLPVDGLRLVDHSEVTEDNVLTAIARRHESRAGLPLLLLGQRFGVLAGMPAFEAARLPVGPHALGRYLAEACEGVTADVDTRLQLYRLFDRQLMPGYLTLVETMNALLDSAKVLPGLTFVPIRAHRRARRDTAGGVGGADSDTAAQAAAADAPTTGQWDEGQIGAVVGAPDIPANDAAGNDPAWAGDTDWGSATTIEQHALAQLQQLLAKRRELIGLQSDASDPERPRAALATVEVDAALGELQSRRGAVDTPRTTTQIRQALLANSRMQRGEATSLSHQDNEAFELLGLLYTEIGRELRQGTRSADLLERLQVPLLRVALQDRSFFVRRQHPARQLLEAVAEAGATWLAEGEADPRLDQQLGSAVDHVVEHYDGNPEVFESANQALTQHLETLARKAEAAERRHVEAARGRDKLELAKQRAAESIATAVGDTPIPKFLRTLLDQAWTDVLSLVLLRDGEDSAQWREHAEATEQIVLVNTGDAPAPQWLQPRIEQALGLVGYQGEEAAAIAGRLAAAVDDSDDPATRTELAVKLKARARLGAREDGTPARPAPSTARNPREEACYNHLRSLPFGSWLEFATNQQGDMVRRRLAWFSPLTGRALLVNQRGQRIDGAHGHDNLDQIARLLAVGEARVVTDDRGGLVERAWQATLGALRGLAGRDHPQETQP